MCISQNLAKLFIWNFEYIKNFDRVPSILQTAVKECPVSKEKVKTRGGSHELTYDNQTKLKSARGA